MFLRIGVKEKDRGAQRFLYRGRDRFEKSDAYESLSIIFVSLASPTTAMYIKNRNAKKFEIKNSNVHTKIDDNSYMDDFLLSRKTQGGFEMHSWGSNDPSIFPATSNTLNPKDENIARVTKGKNAFHDSFGTP